AILLEVHLHAVDDLEQPAPFDAELLPVRGQRARDRMLRLPGVQALDFAAPPVEARARKLRVGRFVDDVVDLATERVERGDGAPSRWRQEQEAVIETRSAARGL